MCDLGENAKSLPKMSLEQVPSSWHESQFGDEYCSQERTLSECLPKRVRLEWDPTIGLASSQITRILHGIFISILDLAN